MLFRSEFTARSVKGFVNIPVDELRTRIREIATDRPVYVMCQSGVKNYLACRILKQNGFEAYNFYGGYRFYRTVKEDETAAEEVFFCGMDK